MRNIGHDSRGPSVVASTLMILTCLVLGLLAGGMLVIGVSLVSFWKSLSPSDFQAWFASHSHLVGRVMIPLGVGGVTVAVAAVVACWRSSATGRGWLLLAALSTMGVMVTYPLFFETTNEAFTRGGPFRFNGAVLARSMGDLALDSDGTWDIWFCRGITSASRLNGLPCPARVSAAGADRQEPAASTARC
jgi:hypothetical protein